MRKTAISSFLMLSCIFFISCPANAQIPDVIDKSVSSLSTIVSTYVNEFAVKTNFSELQNIMEAIYISHFDYNGPANKNMSRSYWLSTEVHNKFRDCVNEMYWCCEIVVKPIEFWFGNINKRNQTVLYREGLIAINTFNALNVGQLFARDSLGPFKLIQPKLIELKNSLNDSSIDLQNDFSPSGFYGQQKEEVLNKEIAKRKFFDEKINSARQIAAQFNNASVNLDKDENNLNELSKINFDGLNRIKISSMMKNTSSQFKKQFFWKMIDLENHCNEFNKWYASASPRRT